MLACYTYCYVGVGSSKTAHYILNNTFVTNTKALFAIV